MPPGAEVAVDPAARAYAAYARLVLETMPEESRIGFTLGFVRTFGVPEIAEVLSATGRMTAEPKARAKATGAAMFALIGQGVDSPRGRRIVADLRRVHDRPGITPELMHYVLACFTLCPLLAVDTYGHRPADAAEREAAYAFHRALAAALDLPEPPGAHGGLAGVEAWMRDLEARRFAATPAAHSLWTTTSGALVAARLPARFAPLAATVAATLLDAPLRAALGVPPPSRPVRALVRWALRLRSRGAARRAVRRGAG